MAQLWYSRQAWVEQAGPEAGRALSSSDTAPVVTTAAAPGQTELVAPAPAQTQGCVLRDIWGLSCASGWARSLGLGLGAPHSPAGPHPGLRPCGTAARGVCSYAKHWTDAALNIAQSLKCTSVDPLRISWGEKHLVWVNTPEMMAFPHGPTHPWASGRPENNAQACTARHRQSKWKYIGTDLWGRKWRKEEGSVLAISREKEIFS